MSRMSSPMRKKYRNSFNKKQSLPPPFSPRPGSLASNTKLRGEEAASIFSTFLLSLNCSRTQSLLSLGWTQMSHSMNREFVLRDFVCRDGVAESVYQISLVVPHRLTEG